MTFVSVIDVPQHGVNTRNVSVKCLPLALATFVNYFIIWFSYMYLTIYLCSPFLERTITNYVYIPKDSHFTVSLHST
jgi:hypothetical protein